jgi:hypothetical protein
MMYKMKDKCDCDYGYIQCIMISALVTYCLSQVELKFYTCIYICVCVCVCVCVLTIWHFPLQYCKVVVAAPRGQMQITTFILVGHYKCHDGCLMHCCDCSYFLIQSVCCFKGCEFTRT